MRPAVTARRLLAALALAGALAPAPAAATGCLAVAGLMAFGTYDPLATLPTDTTATVTVTCTPGLGDPLATAYTLTVAGTGSGNDATRSIAFGASRLYFQVYQDASRTQVWGNGTTSGAGVASSVTSIAIAVPALRTHTAYARMPAGQVVAPGLYLGSLLVTVNY